MRQTIIAGNWKMNGTVSDTETLLKELLASNSKNKDKVKTIVCPPYTSLQTAGKMLEGSWIELGAQDMSIHEKGAFTGEISASMLLTLGVRYVILGHSERRQFHAETDQQVCLKARAALSAGLIPIVCVGELLDQREAGQTKVVVGAQIEGALAGFSPDQLKQIVIAYEPVWAIGTGKTATPEMAQEVHEFIREQLGRLDKQVAEMLPILYGGSVKPGNAADLLGQPDIDGALVGGASLAANDFLGIIDATHH